MIDQRELAQEPVFCMAGEPTMAVDVLSLWTVTSKKAERNR